MDFAIHSEWEAREKSIVLIISLQRDCGGPARCFDAQTLACIGYTSNGLEARLEGANGPGRIDSSLGDRVLRDDLHGNISHDCCDETLLDGSR